MARPRPARNPALLLLASSILLPIALGCAGRHELVRRSEPAAPVAGPPPPHGVAVVGGPPRGSVGPFQRAWEQGGPPAPPCSLTPQGGRQFLDLLIDTEANGEGA